MSLFKARDWWATYCGSDEEFDTGCISVSNIDNNTTYSDKIIVGSYHGVLRIYSPKEAQFKAEDLMLEIQLQQPILQIESGNFISGVDKIHLIVLHPRKFAVYTVSSVSGAVEHGNHYSLNLVYEHILERSAFNLTYGPFGGVKGKDFICVQSMDGMLSFFEQETFGFGRFIPNFLLPGPLAYVAKTDSFVLCTSSRTIDSYKYKTLAVATDASSKEDIGNKKVSGKKLTVDWSTNIGEIAVDMQVFGSNNTLLSIIVLGERSLYCLKDDGTIRFMKKLEFNPSSFVVYESVKDGTVSMLVGTHTKSLLVYQDVTLAWAAQLPHVPVAMKVATFPNIDGVIVTLDEMGFLQCSYLGTDPSMMVTPAPEARDINYEESDSEMKDLQKIIRESTISSEILPPTQQKEDLIIRVQVPSKLDKISQSMGDEGEEDSCPSITITIILESQALRPIENVVLSITASVPIMCSRASIVFPVVGDRNESVMAEVSFYSRGGMIPSNLDAHITATYLTSSDAPRVAQHKVELPLNLVSKGEQPVKNALHKLTIETNKHPVNLAEMFPEMVDDAVIPLSAIGIQYNGGPTVTVLASKTSQRYRIQCDVFEGMWLVLYELVKRLEIHYKKIRDNVAFRASFMGPLPLQEYYELVDAHFEQRRNLVRYREILAQRAQQFRSIQRRLLTRFKDKTPAPLANLDTLLDGTYRQLLALSEAEEECERTLEQCSVALSCATRLINFLIKLWTNMSNREFEVLATVLSPIVSHTEDQGWEEMTDAAISHILRTCLSKSAKDQAVGITPLVIPKDTSKLKKHLALLCDRLNKGGKLDLSMTSGQQANELAMVQQQRQIKAMEPLDEMQEDEEDETDGAPNGPAFGELPPLNGTTSDRLPQINVNKPGTDLGKRILVTKDSEEESMVSRGVAAAAADLIANGT